jgi:16S rRNA processing protein RimM
MRSSKSSKPAAGPAPAAAPVTEAVGTGSTVPAFLEIAQIQTAFGVDGEVRARILTDFPRRFARLKKVFLGDEFKPYLVEQAKVRGNDVFLKLGGVTTPEEAAKLRLKMVQVPIAEAMPLPKGAYYHYQVIGLSVVSVDGRVLGRVAEILPTGGNDVYVVRGEQGELLLPAIADVVQRIDVAADRVVVTLLDGMEPVAVATPSPPRIRPPQVKRQRGAKATATPAEVRPVESGPAEASAQALDGSDPQE